MEELISLKTVRGLASIAIETFREFVRLAKELQAVIKETPEVIEFLRLTKREYSSPLMPIKADCLVYVGEAAKILHVGKGTIGMWEKQGLLVAYYTPGNERKKYWLSEVKRIASKNINMELREEKSA